MGRGKAKFPYPWKGNRFSVYLKADIPELLDHEIFLRSKPIKGSRDRVAPKGLSIPRLIAECVYYVINENKLECLFPSFKRYPEPEYKP